METTQGSQKAGRFIISPGREVSGELTLAGSNTSLFLHDKEHFYNKVIPDRCILGVLHDLTRVSLLDCITTRSGSGGRGAIEDERYHVANIFPHVVIYGNIHVKPTDSVIRQVHFLIDDATTLFNDFDAFGGVIDARPLIEQVVCANAVDRQIATGPDPEILYFTGKREIFSVDTVIGRVYATHNPRRTWGGPGGVRLDNQIFLTIAFQGSVVFEEAISRMFVLLRFLDLLVGRRQNLLDTRLSINMDNDKLAVLQVYHCASPRREPRGDEDKPHPGDVLLDGAQRPEAFSRILASWLDRQENWCDARMRFDNSFAGQRRFTIDRLVGSANMFDILPSSAVPPDVELSVELRSAKAACRDIFLALPQSPERDSVLSALGRVGKSHLKQKVRYRAQRLVDRVGDRFAELSV